MQTLALKTEKSDAATARRPSASSGRSLTASKITVRRVLSQPAWQAKLKVGPPDDVHEREADRIAAEVMRMSEPPGRQDPLPPLPSAQPPPRNQRTCTRCGTEESVQRKETDAQQQEIQRQAIDEVAEESAQPKSLTSAFPPIQRHCTQCESERLQRFPEGDSLFPSTAQKGTVSFRPGSGWGQSSSGRVGGGDSLQLKRKKPFATWSGGVLLPKPESVPANRMQRRRTRCEQEQLWREKDSDRLREDEESQPLQASLDGQGVEASVGPQVEADIRSLQGGGRPLPDSTRMFFEGRFQRDFGSVRVHDGGRAASLASSVNARAFTLGRDIVFGSGQFSPTTAAGRTLIAHELTHVLQRNRSILRSRHAADELSARAEGEIVGEPQCRGFSDFNQRATAMETRTVQDADFRTQEEANGLGPSVDSAASRGHKPQFASHKIDSAQCPPRTGTAGQAEGRTK